MHHAAPVFGDVVAAMDIPIHPRLFTLNGMATVTVNVAGEPKFKIAPVHKVPLNNTGIGFEALSLHVEVAPTMHGFDEY